MGKIYDLTIKQDALYDALFWEEEDSEEAQRIINEILDTQGQATDILKFLSTIYAETKATEEAVYAEKQRVNKIMDARLKRAEKATERLKNLIADTMKNFEIQKVEGEFIGLRLMSDSESVKYGDNFDIEKLPDYFVRAVTTYKPDEKLIKSALQRGEKLEGVYIKKLQQIRIV